MERVRIFIEKLVEYLKKFKNLECLKIFQNRDYFKIYKNHDVNEFFWLVCILGGILRSNKVCKKLKILWLIHNISSACLVIGINIHGFIHINEKCLATTLILLRPICAISITFGTNIMAFVFYKSLEKYTDELDVHLSTSLQQDDQHVAKTKSQFLDIFVVSLLCVTVFSHGAQYHFPFDTGLETNSKVLYLILFIVKFYAVLPSILIPYSGLKMKAIYINKFLNTSYEFINQMKMFSNATLQNLELTHQQEMTIEIDTSDPEERNYHLNLLTRRKNVIYENVGENIAYFAKQHHKLARIHKHIKTYYELASLNAILGGCLLQIIVGTEVVQFMEGRAQFDIWTTRILSLSFIVTHFINESCFVISMMEDMAQKVCNEVYSLPWYLLPTKNRKMIALLLTQFQHIPQFRILGIYPLGAPLVPQILYSSYSYVSFLRVVMLKESQ